MFWEGSPKKLPFMFYRTPVLSGLPEFGTKFVKKIVFFGFIFEKPCFVSKLFILLQSFSKKEKAIADVAQLVEQLICNQLVGGSIPSIGSSFRKIWPGVRLRENVL